MDYLKIQKDTPSPDHEEVVAQMEMDAWVRFAAASLSTGTCRSYEDAAKAADEMMVGFRSRFIDDAS